MNMMSETRCITVPAELLEAALAALEQVNPGDFMQVDPEGKILEAAEMLKSALSRSTFGASLKDGSKFIIREAYICTNCEGVYADGPPTQCDCMPDKQEYFVGEIRYQETL